MKLRSHSFIFNTLCLRTEFEAYVLNKSWKFTFPGIWYYLLIFSPYTVSRGNCPHPDDFSKIVLQCIFHVYALSIFTPSYTLRPILVVYTRKHQKWYAKTGNHPQIQVFTLLAPGFFFFFFGGGVKTRGYNVPHPYNLWITPRGNPVMKETWWDIFFDVVTHSVMTSSKWRIFTENAVFLLKMG